MKEKLSEVDFCVVGGGMAGICAAISAARHGLKVALIHDRPVLGGNASSEVRMWIRGALGPNNRETGILEEIQLENLFRNESINYSIWDSVLYGKVKYEPGISLFLNCSCAGIEMSGNRIKGVKAWQSTSETWHIINAKMFADCSGDSILASLSGAQTRFGREARSEFNEDIAPEKADDFTMGISCLIQARQTPSAQKFTAPEWAYTYKTDADMNFRVHKISDTNFWWIELGGTADCIHDSEEIRDELLKVAFGVWDHIKNYGDHDADHWVLEWIGFLPAKRESRRYVGDYILTQNDIRAEGKFDDTVAYGGWPMDDHNPLGLNHHGEPTIFHPAHSPYGIPYRCLYSRNIENLFCAGRNISATHAALSSTRVMGTCAVLGQAVGTAASIAVAKSTTPRGVYQQNLKELKNRLLDDDCYIPDHVRGIPELSKCAELSASEGDPEPLRNGIDRPISGIDNGWAGRPGAWVQYSFGDVKKIAEVRLVFDSDLNRQTYGMMCHYPLTYEPHCPPKTLVRAFKIEIQSKCNQDQWECVFRETNNYQRLRRILLAVEARNIRIIFEAAWGCEALHIFAFDVR